MISLSVLRLTCTAQTDGGDANRRQSLKAAAHISIRIAQALSLGPNRGGMDYPEPLCTMQCYPQSSQYRWEEHCCLYWSRSSLSKWADILLSDCFLQLIHSTACKPNSNYMWARYYCKIVNCTVWYISIWFLFSGKGRIVRVTFLEDDCESQQLDFYINNQLMI